jgi:hypothetical protein
MNIAANCAYFKHQRHLRYHDPAGRQDALELQHLLRMKFVEAEKDMEMGVNYIKELLQFDSDLGTPRLYVIGSECPNLVNEFHRWSHKVDRDGNIKLDKYEERNDHSLDALRYALYTFKLGKGVEYVSASKKAWSI